MKKIFTILLLLVGIIYANETAHKKKHNVLPLSLSLPYLQTIKADAIVLGEGSVDVYVFIDPYCPYSQNFVDLITSSKKMMQKYKYYLFLYSIKRLHSEAVVSTIYHSNNSLDLLKKVMVNGKKIDVIQYDETKDKVDKIAKVAKTIGVYKRPYLIMSNSKKFKVE